MSARYVSVRLVGPGPQVGPIHVVPLADVESGSTRLVLGAHVVVQLLGKRRKAFIVDMNPLINLCDKDDDVELMDLLTPEKKRVSKRTKKTVPSSPRPLVSTRQTPRHNSRRQSAKRLRHRRKLWPAYVQYDDDKSAHVVYIPPGGKPPRPPPIAPSSSTSSIKGIRRPSVRRQLTYTKPRYNRLQSINAPVEYIDLDGIQPLDDFAAELPATTNETPPTAADLQTTQPGNSVHRAADEISVKDLRRAVATLREEQASLQRDAATLREYMERITETIMSLRYEFNISELIKHRLDRRPRVR